MAQSFSPERSFLRMKASAAFGGANRFAIPAKQDAKFVGSTFRPQDEPCRDVEAAGSPNRTQQRHLEYLATPLANHNEDRTAARAAARTKKSQAVVWPKADTESCNRGQKGASASSSGWLWSVRSLRWADDEGRELREDDVVHSALGEFLNH